MFCAWLGDSSRLAVGRGSLPVNLNKFFYPFSSIPEKS